MPSSRAITPNILPPSIRLNMPAHCLRALMILLIAVPVIAADFSAWSDKTVCRVVKSNPTMRDLESAEKTLHRVAKDIFISIEKDSVLFKKN